VKDLPCYAVPQSSLPSGSCGPETDTDVNDKLNPYINSQFGLDLTMCRFGAMQKMFAQALAQAPQDASLGGNQ